MNTLITYFKHSKILVIKNIDKIYKTNAIYKNIDNQIPNYVEYHQQLNNDNIKEIPNNDVLFYKYDKTEEILRDIEFNNIKNFYFIECDFSYSILWKYNPYINFYVYRNKHNIYTNNLLKMNFLNLKFLDDKDAKYLKQIHLIY